mmetsp:Transcript_29764/g.81588  ORF Transcript_29764/g.81588 Transcript_29764/m.81588 type:complete len:215 (-) Transcript_29764:299-943(-)
MASCWGTPISGTASARKYWAVFAWSAASNRAGLQMADISSRPRLIRGCASTTRSSSTTTAASPWAPSPSASSATQLGGRGLVECSRTGRRAQSAANPPKQRRRLAPPRAVLATPRSPKSRHIGLLVHVGPAAAWRRFCVRSSAPRRRRRPQWRPRSSAIPGRWHLCRPALLQTTSSRLVARRTGTRGKKRPRKRRRLPPMRSSRRRSPRPRPQT